MIEFFRVSLFVSILFVLCAEASAARINHRSCGRKLMRAVNADVQLTSNAKENFPGVLNRALRFHSQKKSSESLRTDYLSVIDFSLPSNARRYFLVNLNNCTYISDFVGHGSGTGQYSNGKKWLKHCAKGSARASRKNLTRIGFYKYTQYATSGKSWRRIYKSYKAIQLKNLNSNRNDDDVNNGNVVIHEASYVQNRPVEQGRSHGCFAFANGRLKAISQKLIGGLVYAHAPQCK